MDDNQAIRMMNEYYGACRANIIYWAAKFKIADHLLNKPMAAEELAQLMNLNLHTLTRFLGYLTTMGILERDSHNCYSVTKYGSTLAENDENSVRNAIVRFEETLLIASDHFDHTLRTGGIAFHRKFGKSYYDHLNDASSHDIDALIKQMQEYTKMFGGDVTSKYDFSKFKHIVDVGGNNGDLLIEILQNTPAHVHGTVFEQPQVAIIAAENIAEHKLSDRCKAVGGNFFESVPAGGDCYLLKFVLSDWNDEECVRILSNVSKQMKADSKLLILQQIDAEKGDIDVLPIDYLLLLVLNGGLRKLSQHERLLKQAHLKVSGLIKVGEHNYSILEAVKEN